MKAKTKIGVLLQHELSEEKFGAHAISTEIPCSDHTVFLHVTVKLLVWHVFVSAIVRLVFG